MATKPKPIKEEEIIIPIENNVPIPTRGNGLWSAYRKVIEGMKVGQSFTVNTQYKRDRIIRLNGKDKKSEIRVTTRKILDGSGWRIWRTQ